MRRVLVLVAGAGGTALFLAAVMTGWLAVIAGAGAGSTASGCEATGVSPSVPAELRPIFTAASARFELGSKGPAVLAGLTSVESGFGRNMGPSSAGAVGWTQFLPSTWRHYGVDADGDGRRDPYDPEDAIFSSARYLRANGAPRDWHRALFAYNHAEWYVDRVLAEVQRFSTPGPDTPGCGLAAGVEVPDASRVPGGAIVAIPGQPGEFIDVRLVPDVLLLIREFGVRVTDGYATRGHEPDGEHPLGLAVDLEPGPGATWDDVDRLARWAEPTQGRPRAPFRWVGYDGDANHGRGHHLHLSWNHAPAPSRRPPAAWVEVLRSAG